MGKRKKIQGMQKRIKEPKSGLFEFFVGREIKRGESFTFFQYVVGIILFLAIFYLYLHTLFPTIGFHDSGEMVPAAYLLGVSHSPGYPLYSLVGNLFTKLPLANIAFRMNLFSAFCGVLAIIMVYFITIILIQRVTKVTKQLFFVPSIVASGILASVYTFWQQAIIAEKYTLNALFATLIIFILLKWDNIRGIIPTAQRYFYLLSFTMGLSFTHHFQTVFLIPAMIYFIASGFLAGKKNRDSTYFFSMVPIFMFLIPLILYLYLLIRGAANPLANWGGIHNIGELIKHLTVQEYSGFFSSSLSNIAKNLLIHLSFFPNQLSWWLIILGFIGLYFLFRMDRRAFFMLTLISSVNISHSIRYTIPNIEDYYIPTFIIFSILIGYSILAISIQRIKMLQYTISLVIILPLLLCFFHYRELNARSSFVANDFIMNLFRGMDEGAIFFSKGDDDLFPIWYLQYIEQRRIDVIPINMILLKHDWYINQLKERNKGLKISSAGMSKDTDITHIRLKNIAREHCQSRPVYSYYIEPLQHGFTLVPNGFLFRVFSEGISNNEFFKWMDTHPPQSKFRRNLIEENTRRIIGIKDIYGMGYNNRAIFYLESGNYIQALTECKKGLLLYPNFPDLLYNMGVSYGNLGRNNEAIEAFKSVLKINPDHINASEGLDICYKRTGIRKKE